MYTHDGKPMPQAESGEKHRPHRSDHHFPADLVDQGSLFHLFISPNRSKTVLW
jgi:hypothetical protein